MIKLFISYRSLDSAKVDACLQQIEAFKDADGKPRYQIWIDRRSIPGGADWWKSIVNGIRHECAVFVFMVSEESVKSENCRAELKFARQLNRPILPVVLPAEYEYNPTKDKNDLKFDARLVPDELNDGRFQYLFFEGSGFGHGFDLGVQRLMEDDWREFRVMDDPADPSDKESALNTDDYYYAEAVDAAWKTNFTVAEKHFQRVANATHSILKEDAHHWMSLLRPYEQMVRYHEKPATRYKVRNLWQEYLKTFNELPKEFRLDVFEGNPFDPKGVGSASTPPPVDPLAQKLALARQFTGKRNKDWKPIIVPLGEIIEGAKLPEMEMCLVPIGTFKMGEGSNAHPQTVSKPYWMARYPVTNAQWRVAVEAKAVKAPHDVEWYNDPKMADCPVVSVTWHQSLAFAQWVGCTLPSELETEYAARGLDNLIYPWGNDWEDGKRAVWDKNSGGKPNPVTSKPEGVSWVGAMHLSGNVWEWQRSEYKAYPYNPDDGREDLVSITNIRRVLRGGSWGSDYTYYLRSSSRLLNSPDYSYDNFGFRCARS